MKIRKLKLYTNRLPQELEFYSNTLGFKLLESATDQFTVQVGWSEMTFVASDKSHCYHYCFLIPSNQLTAAKDWLKERVEVIDIENGRETQFFESWNAESVYFHDRSGNVAELIVRYDLKNDTSCDFDQFQILGINEIGMPTSNIKETNSILAKAIDSNFWKGDLQRFGTNGDQEGLFLLPNYKQKEIWFPTAKRITPEPFEAVIENLGQQYLLQFEDGVICCGQF